MKALLRSTFRADAGDDPELFLRNAVALRESNVDFEVAEDAVLWTWVQDFFSQHHHVPSAQTLREHFTQVQQLEVVDRLDVIEAEKPRTQGDFLKLLETQQENRRQYRTNEILRDAATIATSGLTLKEGRKEIHLRGPVDAIRYVVDQAGEIVTPTGVSRLSGTANSDGEDVKMEYERVESDPLAGIGQLTGIEQMDIALKGAKRKELWTHAAFTGGLKSTLSINWHYNQSVFYRHSSILFSLEMPYEQVRRILYAIHSSHHKFRKIRKKLKIGKCLDYEKIRDGELEEQEKKFYFDYVIPDFNNPANKYGKLHIEVADPDKSDFNVNDLRSKAELLYQKDPAIRMITVDHAGLMQSRNRHNSTTERLNEVLRDLKRLAMNFNRGMGIAVIALFQISREGFKAAEKNGGTFSLIHLSYANEAERSSDIVTASWVDTELREGNQVKYMCLKTRDMAPFKEFLSGVLWPCRRIFTQKDVEVAAARATGSEIDLSLEG
jgi:hypothetical protein